VEEIQVKILQNGSMTACTINFLLGSNVLETVAMEVSPTKSLLKKRSTHKNYKGSLNASCPAMSLLTRGSRVSRSLGIGSIMGKGQMKECAYTKLVF
jgi:hypothetical protein